MFLFYFDRLHIIQLDDKVYTWMLSFWGTAEESHVLNKDEILHYRSGW